MNISDLLELMRVRQWYKNLVIFAAPFFSKTLAAPAYWPALAAGFFALCLVSSAGYVLNDIVDAPADRIHPLKRKRPIPSGRIVAQDAALIAFACALLGLGISLFWAAAALAYAGALLALMVAYTLWFKAVAYLDVLLIALHFLVRTYAGAAIVMVAPTPAFLAGLFALALFLALSKRLADLRYGNKGSQARKMVHGTYTRPTLELLQGAVLVLMAGIYVVFALTSPTLNHALLVASIPFVFYAIWRYRKLSLGGDARAADPPLMLKDRMFAAGCALSGLLILLAAFVS